MAKDYGLVVMGKIRVFRKDKQVKGNNKKTYDITDVWFNVSEQEDDGTYFNKSMNMIFKKDLDKPENNRVIKVQEAFPMITGNGEYRRISLYVGAWEYADEEKKK
jgi:hypothetical protein